MEVLEAAVGLGAEGELVLEVLPEHAARVVAAELVLDVEERVAEVVAAEVGVGVERAAERHRVALGRLPAVLRLEAVAVAPDRAAAPVGVGGAVAVALVDVLVEPVVGLETAGAELAEAPFYVLADRHPQLVPEVQPRRRAEPPVLVAVRLVAEQVVAVLRHQVRAPAAGVAGHPAEAALGVERVPGVGQPEDRHLEQPQPHAAQDHVVVGTVLHLALGAPVGVAWRVGAGGGDRGVVEEDEPGGVALQLLGAEGDHPLGHRDVAGGDGRLGDVVDGDAVRLDVERPGIHGGGEYQRDDHVPPMTGSRPPGRWRRRAPRTTRGGGGVRRRR